MAAGCGGVPTDVRQFWLCRLKPITGDTLSRSAFSSWPSGVCRCRASRLMSRPCALRRWKRSAPSGLTIGTMCSVSASSSRAVTGSCRCAVIHWHRSNSADVAVGSSPCICDHSRTAFGPRPTVRWWTFRPSTDCPSTSLSNNPAPSRTMRATCASTISWVTRGAGGSGRRSRSQRSASACGAGAAISCDAEAQPDPAATRGTVRRAMVRARRRAPRPMETRRAGTISSFPKAPAYGRRSGGGRCGS